MTVLIDSSIWIEYWKGTPRGTKARPIIEGDEEKIVSTINVAEVYRYFLSQSEELAEKYSNDMQGSGVTVPVDTKIAKHAAKIRFERKLGLGDAIILSTALAKNARIITGDYDFKNEENVEIIT